MKKLLCPYKILKIYLSISKKHQYTYNHCDYYILLSEAFKKEFSKLNFFRTSKIIAISNPLTIEKFPVNENKENNLLFIGSINLRKGIDYLMRIWEEIEHNTTVWNLLILGQGEDLSYVTKYIADHQLKHIKLLGYQSNIIPYLQESKCLLMTSRYEGFPLVLPETMAYGCVPFAFKSFAAVNDILTSDTGILIKPFDCEEYSKELMDLINDTERWHSMSKNCIQRARTVFSMDKILAQWEKVLN
ncbi:MAG: glycosyltransferase [Prevotella sp.]|jgi:glycosyltransferase involved in cell wall biosynthesis|nr:glycosyltransferase [Prevotella sp.]